MNDDHIIVKIHKGSSGFPIAFTTKSGSKIPRSGLIGKLLDGEKFSSSDRNGKLQPVSVVNGSTGDYSRSDPNYKLSDNLLNLPQD